VTKQSIPYKTRTTQYK